MLLMVNSIISNCLVTICMLSYSNINSSPHRKTFDIILWDIIAHLFHIGTNINPFFSKHTVSPVGWDIPRVIESFSQTHHTCTRTIDIHDWISISKFGWIVGQNASTTHQSLVNGNTVSQNRFRSRSRRTLSIKGMVILVALIISAANKSQNSTSLVIH